MTEKNQEILNKIYEAIIEQNKILTATKQEKTWTEKPKNKKTKKEKKYQEKALKKIAKLDLEKQLEIATAIKKICNERGI